MAADKKNNGKDLGTPIGIIIGVSVILIAIGIASVEGISQRDKFSWFFGIQIVLRVQFPPMVIV